MSEPADASDAVVAEPSNAPAADVPNAPTDVPDLPADATREAADADVLAHLADRPLAEHAEVFEELHARLQRTLAEIDGG